MGFPQKIVWFSSWKIPRNMDDLEVAEVPPFQEASQTVDKSFCINMVLSENGVTLLNGHSWGK